MDGWDVKIIIVASVVSAASASFGGSWAALRPRVESRVVQVSISIAVSFAVVAIGLRVLGPFVVWLDKLLPGSFAG